MMHTTAPGATHLTESERHGAADGTLGAPGDARRRHVAEHLAVCADCEADVARLRRVIDGARAAELPPAPLDELWPAIRARIERDKVVALVPGAPSVNTRTRRRRWIAGVASVVGAGLVAATVLVSSRTPRRAPGDERTTARDGNAVLVSDPADSARAYEDEVRALLDAMALRRAMLRPDVAERMDEDVRVIDAAIAELQDALRRDPNNAALRQLLAASYRQKRDLLKRAADAS